MSVHNADIAKAFNDVADLLEFENENPFRVRAYRNAPRTLGNLDCEVSAMLPHDEDRRDQYGSSHRADAGRVGALRLGLAANVSFLA